VCEMVLKSSDNIVCSFVQCASFFLLFGVDLYYYFYTEMVCAGGGSRQSNAAIQNLQTFIISLPFC